jgi:hypothetical protein
LKIVAVIAEDSPVKTLIVATLFGLSSIEFQYYTPDSLNSVILDDQIGTAIYIAAKIDEEIEKIATVRSIVSSLVLIADRDIPALRANLFVSLKHLASSREVIDRLRQIRSFIEAKDYEFILSRLTARQKKVLEIHCLFLPESEAVSRSGVCRSTYQRTLKEVKVAFDVSSNHELRQLFCQEKRYKNKPNDADGRIVFPADTPYRYG